HGHKAGDDILRTVANNLDANKRRSEYLGRHGGDEFVLLFPGADEDNATKAARRLATGLALANLAHGVSASFGIYSSLPSASSQETYEEAVDKADEAMYLAKAVGQDIDEGGVVVRYSDFYE